MSTLFTCIWRIKLRRKFAHFRCITHLRASQLSNATQLLKYLLRTTSYFPAGFLCVKTHFMRQKRLTLKLALLFADIRAARPLKKKLMSLRVKWIMISLRSRLIYFKRCEIDASATRYASSCVTTSSWSVFWCQESFLTTRIPFVLNWKSHMRIENPKWTSAVAFSTSIVICKVPITNSRTTWTCKSSPFVSFFILSSLGGLLKLQCLHIKGPRVSLADQTWLDA